MWHNINLFQNLQLSLDFIVKTHLTGIIILTNLNTYIISQFSKLVYIYISACLTLLTSFIHLLVYIHTFQGWSVIKVIRKYMSYISLLTIESLRHSLISVCTGFAVNNPSCLGLIPFTEFQLWHCGWYRFRSVMEGKLSGCDHIICNHSNHAYI